MVRVNGETVSLQTPGSWSLRRLCWNLVNWCCAVTNGGYHGTIGVAVDDVAGGGDKDWEQDIAKLKQRVTFGLWEVGNSAVERSHKQRMDPCASCSQLTSRATWRCDRGGATRHEVRTGIGALGYMARECRPDLSGPVSILLYQPGPGVGHSRP